MSAAEGTLLFPNAERHLRPLAEIREIFAAVPEAIARTMEIAERCRFSLDELKYEYPTELRPPAQTPLEYLTQLTWQGAAEPLSGRLAGKGAAADRIELQLIGELRYEVVLSHRVGFGAVRPVAEHLVPGPRLGGELGGVLLLGSDVGRSGDERSAVRAVHQPRAERGAGYRRRLRARAARGGAAVCV